MTSHILIETRLLAEGIMFSFSYYRYHEFFSRRCHSFFNCIYLYFPRRCWDNKMKLTNIQKTTRPWWLSKWRPCGIISNSLHVPMYKLNIIWRDVIIVNKINATNLYIITKNKNTIIYSAHMTRPQYIYRYTDLLHIVQFNVHPFEALYWMYR